MTRRSKLWIAWLFTLVNLGGGFFAARSGEPLHTAVHGVLLLVGAVWLVRLTMRTGQQDSLEAHPAEQRLEQLQQSVDAIALEVERISEAQRFIAKLEQERAEKRRPT